MFLEIIPSYVKSEAKIDKRNKQIHDLVGPNLPILSDETKILTLEFPVKKCYRKKPSYTTFNRLKRNKGGNSIYYGVSNDDIANLVSIKNNKTSFDTHARSFLLQLLVHIK